MKNKSVAQVKAAIMKKAREFDNLLVTFDDYRAIEQFLSQSLDQMATAAREETIEEIKPLIKLPTTLQQQRIYEKFIAKEYYPHAFGCEFADGKCNCGYE